MELIPYISQVIFYIVLLLIFVLIVSFLIGKNKEDDKKEEILAERRKYIRTYIERTSREMTGEGKFNKQTTLRASLYTPPKFISKESQNRTGERQTRSRGNSKNNERYKILNNGMNKTEYRENCYITRFSGYPGRNRHFVS